MRAFGSAGRAIALGLLTFAAAGCGEDGAPDLPSIDTDTVDVTASLTPVDGGLLVSYRVVNAGDDEVLVANLVPEMVGAGVRYRAGEPYVTENDGVVTLANVAFERPEGVALAAEPRVGVTRVPAGQQLVDEFTVPLPLSPGHPFGSDQAGSVPAEPDSARYCLGTVLPPFEPALGLRREEGVWAVFHTPAAQSQYVFCTDPVDVG